MKGSRVAATLFLAGSLVFCTQRVAGQSGTTMEQRGRQAMGFSQKATTHHFFLKASGGWIEVTANDPGDAASRNAIRRHLRHIASAFAAGDFSDPIFIHDQIPPGVPEMKDLRRSITYQFVALPRGGRVVIRSEVPKAIRAIHEFLRFQIRAHKTGDPLH